MRNGRVHITSQYTAGGKPHMGSAHVHRYATSVIMQELQKAHRDECRLTISDPRDCDSIMLEYVAGPRKGRTFIFTPYEGDEVGWSEMVAFAMSVKNIWGAGYYVTTMA